MPPLNNNRHERFVAGLLEGKSASQAYADAGYQPDDGNAARLNANQKIKARLAELQSEVAGQTKLTVESLLAELEQARAKATDLRQLSAAVRAIESKAKISGLLIQRTEIGGPGDFSGNETAEEVVEAVCQHDAGNYPELAGYFHYTDQVRAEILHHFMEINAIVERRREEAKAARYADLRASYRPRLFNGNN